MRLALSYPKVLHPLFLLPVRLPFLLIFQHPWPHVWDPESPSLTILCEVASSPLILHPVSLFISFTTVITTGNVHRPSPPLEGKLTRAEVYFFLFGVTAVSFVQKEFLALSRCSVDSCWINKLHSVIQLWKWEALFFSSLEPLCEGSLPLCWFHLQHDSSLHPLSASPMASAPIVDRITVESFSGCCLSHSCDLRLVSLVG